MFILPYQSTSYVFQGIRVQTIRYLTVGGRFLWREDDSLDVLRDILEPNGIYLASPPVWVKDTVFCQVDHTRTKLSDLYQWEEIPLTDRDTFCWRTYYLMAKETTQGTTADWLPVPVRERLEPYSLQEVMDRFSSLPRDT